MKSATLLLGVLLTPIAAMACDVDELSVVGSYRYQKGHTVFEDFSLSMENNQRRFQSWLHKRPENIGQWSLQDCILLIEVDLPDESVVLKVKIIEANPNQLVLRFDGHKGTATFKKQP